MLPSLWGLKELRIICTETTEIAMFNFCNFYSYNKTLAHWEQESSTTRVQNQLQNNHTAQSQ